MLSRNFRAIITSWLSRRNKRIYCSTSTSSTPTSYVKEIQCKDVQEKINEIKLKIKKMKGKSILDDKEILNIINHVYKVNPDMINVCTNQLKLCKTDIDALYFIDRNIAAKYVSLIKDDLLKNTCFVAELNPGYGVLTTELLKADVPLIHLYETKKELHPILNAIHTMYPGRLDLRNFHLFAIYNFFYKFKDENQIQQILEGVKSKKWEDETSMQIVGATTSKYFFYNLIQSLLLRNCFMTYGRPVFYCAIPPSLWHVSVSFFLFFLNIFNNYIKIWLFIML